MIVFVHHYKQEYYQFKFHQLSAYKQVIYTLFHIFTCIRKMEPIWSYGQ